MFPFARKPLAVRGVVCLVVPSSPAHAGAYGNRDDFVGWLCACASNDRHAALFTFTPWPPWLWGLCPVPVLPAYAVHALNMGLEPHAVPQNLGCLKWHLPRRAVGLPYVRQACAPGAESTTDATCYSLFDGIYYSDNRSNSKANTCNKPQLLEEMHLLDKRSTQALPIALMIHDNSSDRTTFVPGSIPERSLRNGYHIQGRQQARKLPNPDTGRLIGPPLVCTDRLCWRCTLVLNWLGHASGAVTLKKLECSKQAYALDTLAWDNTTGF
ncbi:hypothetical protein Fmac_032983 [Flemingia macrophylla]|uniref:Uncharacterized protein n=1 Tax=Flemingia macrophylla TaxID=520843 RepID=A0ABD1L6H1_9FABA